MEIPIDCQEYVLLTGAGFTKNFGAPLAKEMWGVILGNQSLDVAPEVRRILLEDFDFESVYNRVMWGARLPLEEEKIWEINKTALRKAVKEAYEYIDNKILAFSSRPNAPQAVNIYKIQEFISKFSGTSQRPGFFFTLNQDLFIERHYYNGQRPTLPGINQRPSWFTVPYQLEDPCSFT